MKIVYVEWLDASETGRYHKNVSIPKDQDIGLQTNYSVGIVLEDTEEYLALALTLSESEWYVSVISIPKVNIKLEKVLLETEDEKG